MLLAKFICNLVFTLEVKNMYGKDNLCKEGVVLGLKMGLQMAFIIIEDNTGCIKGMLIKPL